MIINVFDQQTELKISIDQVKQLVQHVIHQEGQSCDQVDIYFVDSSMISQLHQQFFNDPTSTDCISLPMDEEQGESHYRLLGEIFVCPAVALAYAAKHGENPYLETTLYIVHSLLHLMGYDDQEEEDILFMRKAEDRHMKNLQLLNLQLRL